MATKNVVAVNHLNTAGPYLFAVPENKSVGYGQLCLAKTKTGKQIYSVALCDSFSVDDTTDEYAAVIKMYKATEPLQPIIGVFEYKPFDAEEETPEPEPEPEPDDGNTEGNPSETDGE